MEIELSEDLQHYKESLVLGLTAKQFLFSALALGVGTGIVLLLYEKNRDYFELLCGNPFCCTSGTDWVL
ncbi:MAG: PrgI family protein [Ruminococcus sp.]